MKRPLMVLMRAHGRIPNGVNTEPSHYHRHLITIKLKVGKWSSSEGSEFNFKLEVK